MPILTQKQAALLAALKASEEGATPINIPLLARETGYATSSLRTYLTKRLEGAVVRRDDDGNWLAQGAIACTPEQFALHMTQNHGARHDISSQVAWRAALADLLKAGAAQGYTLDVPTLDLAVRLRAPAPAPEESKALQAKVGMTYTASASEFLADGWESLEMHLVDACQQVEKELATDFVLWLGLMQGLDALNQPTELLILWFALDGDWNGPRSVNLDQALRSRFQRLLCHQTQGMGHLRFPMLLATGGTVYQVWHAEGTAPPIKLELHIDEDGVNTFGAEFDDADVGPLPAVVL